MNDKIRAQIVREVINEMNATEANAEGADVTAADYLSDIINWLTVLRDRGRTGSCPPDCVLHSEVNDGASGQDRESYTDTQDRDNYTTEDGA